jgi:hypothetical protein
LEYDVLYETHLLYINGTNIFGDYYPAFVMSNAASPFYLGNRVAGTADANIEIDELRIWALPRTYLEIADNIYSNLTGTETGLQVYYKMNEQSGNSLIDLATANGSQNGTFNGSVKWMNVYCQGEATIPLEAKSSGSLKWYTVPSGGTGSTTAPTPGTALSGTTSYWVCQTNNCGEGPRSQMQVTVTAATLATGNLTQMRNITAPTSFATACGNLIASLTPNGAAPVSGNTTAKLWIETTQNNGFVKRHFEITPASNAAAATSNVTLYFTQQNFDDFNAVNTLKLPTGPSDAAGISRLLVEKRSGTSNDGSGLPATYTGTITTIDPVDADVVWNATSSRWEVSFDITGFSGFFVKTSSFTLPVSLISFTATKQANDDVLLQWKTTDEQNLNRFEVERSNTGTNFEKTGTVTAVNLSGVNNYQLNDNSTWTGNVRYYRLKSVDNDGKFRYSVILKISNEPVSIINVYPNPAKDMITIQATNKKLLQSSALLQDVNGKTVKTFIINNQTQSADISGIPAGIYVLYFADGSVVKLVKE